MMITEYLNPEYQVAAVDVKKLQAQLDTAIDRGWRQEAARLRGEILGLKPIQFSDAVRPKRIWNSTNVRAHDSSYNKYDGKRPQYMQSERERIVDEGHAGRTILTWAGVRPHDTYSREEALEVYVTKCLVEEIGTFYEEDGGISVRQADGSLLSFEAPSDPETTELLHAELQAAGYTISRSTLPIVIGNNPVANAEAFAAQN